MPPASSCYDGADNTKGWRGLYNAQPLWKAGSIFKVNPTSLLQAIPLLDIYAKETKMWDFPGSPVVKSFHGRRHGSQGTKTPHDLAKKIENVRPQSLQEWVLPAPDADQEETGEAAGGLYTGTLLRNRKGQTPDTRHSKCSTLNGCAAKEAGCKMYILFSLIWMIF